MTWPSDDMDGVIGCIGNKESCCTVQEGASPAKGLRSNVKGNDATGAEASSSTTGQATAAIDQERPGATHGGPGGEDPDGGNVVDAVSPGCGSPDGGNPRGSSRKHWWRAFLTLSIFTFASQDLEDDFQEYAIKRPNPWAVLHSSLILLSLLRFIINYWFAEEELRAAVPSSTAIWMLAHAGACIVIPAISLCYPGVYCKFRRAIHAFYMVFVALSFNTVRVSVLWMHVVGATAPHSWKQSHNFFFVKNFHAAIVWLLHLAYPIGQFPEVILASVILFNALAFNRSMCDLPLLTHQSVRTLSAVMSSPKPVPNAVESISKALLFLADPAMPVQELRPEASCAAALSLWQVLAWWGACHTTLAADLCRRRSFLRTSAALTRIGPAHRLAASKWPLQSTRRLLVAFMASFGISVCASMFWLNAYSLLV